MPEFNDSAAVSRVEYDGFTRTLHVWFRGTVRYSYEGVPAVVYRRFCEATSRGRFFQRHIRPRYDLIGKWDELDQTA